MAISLPQESSLSHSYRGGIVMLMWLISSFIVVWGIILVGMKLRGKALGCAAGYAFENSPAHTRSCHGESSETASSNDDHCWGKNQVGNGDVNHDTLSQELEGAYVPQMQDDECSESTQRSRLWSREGRVQGCFLFFGLAVAASVFMIFSLSFHPLRATTSDSTFFIQDARDILNETQSALTSLADASENSLGLVASMDMNLSRLCPNYTTVDIEAALGVDLESLLVFLSADYVSLASRVSENVTSWSEVVHFGAEALSLVEGYFSDIESHMWILPAIVIPLSIAVAIALSGCYLSRTRQSSQRFRQLLSFCVLPLLIGLALLCWLIAAASAALASVASDACLSGSLSGSPSETVSKILVANNMDSGSLVLAYIKEFTTTCDMPVVAIDFIMSIQNEIRKVTGFISESLSKVDAVGLANLEEYCAADRQLGVFLSKSERLGQLLSSADVSLVRVSDALSCERVYAVYDDAINDAMCTNIASALSWGFICFLVAGVATIGMITLRASWQHSKSEDKIYNDNEIAENMVLDEHEEYLLYISKYKHEWEEYQGVPASALPDRFVGATHSGDDTSREEIGRSSACPGSFVDDSSQFVCDPDYRYSNDDELGQTVTSVGNTLNESRTDDQSSNNEGEQYTRTALCSLQQGSGNLEDNLDINLTHFSCPSSAASLSTEDDCVVMLSPSERRAKSRYKMILSQSKRRDGSEAIRGSKPTTPLSRVLSCKFAND
jgi:hypothetical protein